MTLLGPLLALWAECGQVVGNVGSAGLLAVPALSIACPYAP